MKNLYYFFTIICVMVISCEKSNYEMHENNAKESVLAFSKPLTYSSLEDMRNAIYSGKLDVKSSDFVSYAETVMQEDGYDDLPWAIRSERFASILNVDGEVVFNNTFLKLCRYGVIYAPVDKIDKARAYASYDDCRGIAIPASGIPSYLSKEDCTFTFINDPDIFVYDSFGVIATAIMPSLETKAPIIENVFKEYNCDQEDLLVNSNGKIKWKKNFNVASGDEQKYYFTSDICNDTRIFQDNYGVYSESGVVTKTMEKKSVWKKFENKIHAGITDLILHEENVNVNLSSQLEPLPNPIPCLCVHNFKVNIAGELANRNLVIATVSGYSKTEILSMTNSAYESLKREILEWISTKSNDITALDGIRFYIPRSAGASTGDCYIRLNNEESSGVVEDIRILMNYFWGGADIKATSELLDDNIAIATIPLDINNTYHVEKVIMYGYSIYDGKSRGSKLTYNYDDSKIFN